MMPIRRLQTLAALLVRGELEVVRRIARTQFYSETTACGLRRDLTAPHAAPPAKLAVSVRPFQAADAAALLERPPGAKDDARVELEERGRMLATGLPTCWVAVTAAGEPAYMQWLIAARHNAALRDVFNGLFPPLAPDEALLEGAYTVERFRGLGVMAHAMAELAEQARALGARYVLTYVPIDNVASLKGCARAGFVPERLRAERWRGFRRSVEHGPLPAAMMARVTRQLGMGVQRAS